MLYITENGKTISTKELSGAQKKGLKELSKILSRSDRDIRLEPLADHLELIEKEWTSKKGVAFIKVNGTQLEKDSIRYYSVDMNTGDIHHTGALTK